MEQLMTLAFFGIGDLMLLFISLPWKLLYCAFWIWMLISTIRNQNLGYMDKICWVLTIVFLPLIGVSLYFFIAHSNSSKPTTA
jgi:hypothetical protein